MSSMFNVTIHSEISEFPTEKRYDAGIKILDLKKKLELITGANHLTMKISMSIGDKVVGELNDNEQTLGHYVERAGANGDVTLKLVVTDSQPSNLLSGDAPKFQISEDKYLQRPNNARNFIKEMREKRMSGQSASSQ